MLQYPFHPLQICEKKRCEDDDDVKDDCNDKDGD